MHVRALINIIENTTFPDDYLNVWIVGNRCRFRKLYWQNQNPYPTEEENIHYQKILLNSPGIYLLCDKNKEILYVGKSVNIYKRVNQHLSKQNMSFKLKEHFHKIKYVYPIFLGSSNLEPLEEFTIKAAKPLCNFVGIHSRYH